jgi:hypothetical protein
MTATRTLRALGFLSLALLSACGELTSGGVGEVEVYTTAEDPQPTAASSRAPSGGMGAPESPSALVEGQLLVELQTYVRSEASGDWIEITDGFRTLTLDLRGGSESRVAAKTLAAGRYTAFRAVFRRVEASVAGGLIVGGVPVLGAVRVDMEPSGSVTVERPISLELETDGSADVILGLRASTWLASTSLVTRTVASAAFSSATTVRVR